MKKIMSLMLALLMLLASCASNVADTTVPTTDSEPPATEPAETTPPEQIVTREDYTIEVKEDGYVMNLSGDKAISYLDTNFGAEAEIHTKSNGNTLARYGFLKFDISSLKEDGDFTAVELDLTQTARQSSSAANPYAVLEVYGADTSWSESSLTWNTQPNIHDYIAKNDKIPVEVGAVSSFDVTDYVKKALSEGKTEIALYLKEATPTLPLHVRWASKEAGENAPRLSVYHGIRNNEDEDMNNGTSQSGIDTIIGVSEPESYSIDSFEDTYVEGGDSVDKNFGKSEVIENKAAHSETLTTTHRISLLKFDISDIDLKALEGKALVKIQLALNVTFVEKSGTARVINVYTCDPDAWDESTVTYNTICERGEKVATGSIERNKMNYIDVTDYVLDAKRKGENIISMWLEGESSSAYRTTISSSESASGKGPCLNVVSGDASFTTKINYDGKNPWDVAAEAVSNWLNRYDKIQANGRSDAELIVKKPGEYTLSVDVADASKTDGAKTAYTKYPTRNISTLLNYTSSTAEVEKYDIYGGLMDESMKQEATGFFYTKRIGDRTWVIDPLGYPFYRTAMVLTQPYASQRQKEVTLAKYGSFENWAVAANDRLNELGFNSLGGWSDIAGFSKLENPMSLTSIFDVATSYGKLIGIRVNSGGNSLDIDIIPSFDPAFEEYANARVKERVAPYATDSRVYGWMSDNELSSNIRMLDHALTLDYTDARYAYTYATAWTFMYLKTGKSDVSLSDVTDALRDEFLAMTYDRYFEVITSALERYAPNHMYMGCRFLIYNAQRESVMRVAGYWCDIVTINYYYAWEGDPAHMQNLGNWLGDTPFVVTEWYAKGMDVWENDNLMTNKSGAGWTVRNQDARGKFYQNYALMLMECKDCVGFDWFRYWDNDPLDTSADPSNTNSNKGVYSNAGEEYTDLTKYMEELNNQKYNLVKFFDER